MFALPTHPQVFVKSFLPLVQTQTIPSSRKKHFRPSNWPGQRWWRESRHYNDDSDAFLHMISNLSVFNLTLIQSNFPGGSAGKEPARREGDLGSISGVGKALGDGNGHTLLYSGLENSTDYIVHGFAKSRTD